MIAERPPRLGGRVRTAEASDADALGRIHVASWHASYRDLITPHNLARIEVDRTIARFRRQLWTDDETHVQVLEVDEQVVGYVSSGPTRSLGLAGEVFELYLDPTLERRGGGTRLMTSALWSLAARQLSPCLVWVLSGNLGARRFYEAMRGREVTEASVRVGDQMLRKTAYAWVDYLPWPTE